MDACCGSRMFWFDKENPNVTFMDNRELEDTLCDGRKLVIKPDIVGDFRKYHIRMILLTLLCLTHRIY